MLCCTNNAPKNGRSKVGGKKTSPAPRLLGKRLAPDAQMLKVILWQNHKNCPIKVILKHIALIISNDKAIIVGVPQLRLPTNTEWTTSATNGQQKGKKDIRGVKCQWQLRDCIMQTLLSTRNTSWIFFITSSYITYYIHLVCTLQFFSIKSSWLFTVTFRLNGLPQE